MDLEAEIHAINKKLGDLVVSITLLKERRVNDKEDADTLSTQVKELSVAVNRLNLTIGKMDGIQEGKSTIMKWVWTIFGGLITLWILWVSASVQEQASNYKTISRDIRDLKGLQ